MKKYSHWPEYRLISHYYGEECAKRSGVPLMNHIDEGLMILEEIEASYIAKRAFCLHPILQGDDVIADNMDIVANLSPTIVLLTMEYRKTANAALSDCVKNMGRYGIIVEPPKLSPLGDVNDMLIADKVQNRKDFCLYHKGKHERSAELDLYFTAWLEALGVSDSQYEELVSLIS